MAVAEITNLIIEKGTDFDATFNLFEPDSYAVNLTGVSAISTYIHR
jgi:hypothetical protein